MNRARSTGLLLTAISVGTLATAFPRAADPGAVGPAGPSPPAQVHAPAGSRTGRLPSLTSEALDEIRKSPAAIDAIWKRCRREVATGLGPAFDHLTERERQYVFCTAVAHAMAPWGSDSTATRLPDLLKARTLNCGNYGLLAVYLARSFGAGGPDEPNARFVGWEGGAVGNHQMLFLDRAGRRSLLLDPTLGLIADVDFDTFASGKPIAPDRIVIFRKRDQVKGLERCVTGALTGGRCRPSDLLYYFEDLEHLMERYGDPYAWPTPGGAKWRVAFPRPTPAAATRGS
jgi:hypothetical protein